MAKDMTAGLVKMEIESYEYNIKTGNRSNIKSLKVSINPTNYKQTFSSPNKEETSEINLANGGTFIIKVVELTETVSFTLLLDDSGIIPQTNPVGSDINWIKQNLARMDGEIHATRYVDIKWGPLFFETGQMTKCDIDCYLFGQDGTPLRAKADLAFQRITKLTTVEKKSPDLTRIRVVRDGDTLPLMCEEVYKDPSYYAKIAEVNGLANFMNLQPGQKIFFPPLKPES